MPQICDHLSTIQARRVYTYGLSASTILAFDDGYIATDLLLLPYLLLLFCIDCVSEMTGSIEKENSTMERGLY